MGAPRTLAERLLRALLRCAPEGRRAWVEAMLRGVVPAAERGWLGCGRERVAYEFGVDAAVAVERLLERKDDQHP